MGDRGAGRDVIRDPHVAADDGALPQRHAAQDGGAGIDDHVVFDNGMARLAFFQVALGVGRKALGAQRHGLIDAYAPAQARGFADDDAGAVVDEAARADLRAGMDVDAGFAMGCLLYTSPSPRDS